MVSPRLPALAPLLLFGLASAQEPGERWTLDLETGFASTRYNQAKVPNPSGTEVNLGGVIGRSWRPFGRVSLRFSDRNGGSWKALYAPLRQFGSGELGRQTDFAGQTFGAGMANATYQFDSYRLTYRKPWKGTWEVGATLKLRAAQIRLRQGATIGEERNVGLVPLLHIFGAGALGHGLGYEVEVDGLAGGPGRAVDLSLRATRSVSSRATAFVGLRVLEGGADVPKVKNFAWVTYVTAGVSVRF